MGGDHGLKVTVPAVIEFLRHDTDCAAILVGREEDLHAAIAKAKALYLPTGGIAVLLPRSMSPMCCFHSRSASVTTLSRHRRLNRLKKAGLKLIRSHANPGKISLWK